MSLYPLKYSKYVFKSNWVPNKIRVAVIRFPNNHGAYIWSKKGSNGVNISVIKFFDIDIKSDESKIRPYIIDNSTGIISTSVKRVAKSEVGSILEKIINL